MTGCRVLDPSRFGPFASRPCSPAYGFVCGRWNSAFRKVISHLDNCTFVTFETTTYRQRLTAIKGSSFEVLDLCFDIKPAFRFLRVTALDKSKLNVARSRHLPFKACSEMETGLFLRARGVRDPF